MINTISNNTLISIEVNIETDIFRNECRWIMGTPNKENLDSTNFFNDFTKG